MDVFGTTTADEVVRRIERATNSHDLEALVDCFDEAFVSESPVDPARDFQGRDQVRRNWAQIFEAVPDLSSRLVRSIGREDVAWAEWEWAGTRRDGGAHLMRGVTIIASRDGHATSVRFYMEPVDVGGLDADAGVRQVLTSDRAEVGHVAEAGEPSPVR